MDEWIGEDGSFFERRELSAEPITPRKIEELEVIDGRDEFPFNSQGTLLMQDQMGNWAVKGEYIHATSDRIYYKTSPRELIISRRDYQRFAVATDKHLSQLNNIFGPATGRVN